MTDYHSTDVLTPEQRSYCMSRIRGKDTKPEIRLRKALWALGYRYRLGYKLPGKPDLVFPRKKIAVFVDGCFWHCCPQHLNMPKKNAKFWEEKLLSNVERDKLVERELEASGWVVVRFWEHDVKDHLLDCVEMVRSLFN